jgi:hypothetical protein
MRNFFLGILVCFLISATTVATLTSRSKEQIIVHGTDAKVLCNTIDSYYKTGYRIVNSFSQSVSTSVSAEKYYYNNGYNSYREIKGEIIVVMER